MHIDLNKGRIQADETPRERALRERVEQLEARLAKIENPKPPEPKK